MFDSPEFLKFFYGMLTAGLTGVAGVGYKKIQKIDSSLEERPTKEETKELINSEVKVLQAKQDFIINLLDDVKVSVRRLEDKDDQKHIR